MAGHRPSACLVALHFGEIRKIYPNLPTSMADDVITPDDPQRFSVELWRIYESLEEVETFVIRRYVPSAMTGISFSMPRTRFDCKKLSNPKWDILEYIRISLELGMERPYGLKFGFTYDGLMDCNIFLLCSWAAREPGPVSETLVKSNVQALAGSVLLPPASSVMASPRLPELLLTRAPPDLPLELSGASLALLLEEQLADGRERLIDTETPSLADLSAHLAFKWVRFFKALCTRSVSVPALPLHRVVNILFVGYDDVEAGTLRMERGEVLSIMPEDNVKVPTVGKLVALNREEVMIETTGSSGHAMRCHFLRIAYTIRPESRPSTKLGPLPLDTLSFRFSCLRLILP
ncbi:hypothetical protein OBBRIDRAFT_863201 [Obba rivulosa]|uniref:DUF7962 domain-containing protein n=1 Tax=Obba rivulosa TaxID=1052685 RepID=A0A8E2AHP5_9APHY|nr:hypothetical protein OBBRIDRAFT_863201 [Obba rivulosa]